MENEELYEEEVYHMNDPKRTIRRLLNSMAAQKRRLAVVLVSVAFYTVFTIIAPFYSASLIDLIWGFVKQAGQTQQAFHITWQTGGRQMLILLLLYLISGAFYALQSYLMASFAEKLNLQLRQQVGQKLQRLPLAYFDRHQPGEIMSRVTNDLEKMSDALQTGLLSLFVAVGTIVGALVIMFSYSILLTVVFLVFIGLSLLLTRAVSEKTLRYSAERQDCVAVLNSRMEEAYTGRNIVKAFNCEAASEQRILDAADRLAVLSEKADFMMNAINPAIRIVNRCGQVLIAVLGAGMLLNGQLTPGQFQAFFQYVSQVSEPLTQLSYMLNSMQSALASVERVYALLDEEEVSPEPFHPVKIERAEGNVDFYGVKFGYVPGKLLMDGISFSAKSGQKIAVVGSTGAGKTTLVNLLMRFYDISSGSILLDGVDTRRLTRENLRQNIGMVLQDTWLFEGTIAENIAYGCRDATQKEIVAAAKAARADAFIRTMPQGYDTFLASDCETLSAGQRQLLTIARVMLSNPAILILDEATSSVDTQTEAEIGRAMKSLMARRTSFVIAHRLSTIVDADLILVMQNGTIIEQGDHRALLKQGGAYAQLYNSQFAP